MVDARDGSQGGANLLGLRDGLVSLMSRWSRWNERRPREPSRLKLKPVSQTLRETVKATSLVEINQRQQASQCLTGDWRKDKLRSDDMRAAIRIMRLNWVMRHAVEHLVDSMKIIHTPTHWTTVLQAGPLDIRETYDLSGTVSRYRRRDLRTGGHAGRVRSAQSDEVIVEYVWGNPFRGSAVDTFRLAVDGGEQLTMVTTMETEDGRAEYTTIWRRRHAD